MTSSSIFIGIGGDVIALDRATGQILWKTVLRATGFVNVLLDRDRLIAVTKGAVYCLEPSTGQVLWRNDLPGEGVGLATIATASGSSTAVPSIAEKERQDAANSAP